MANTTLPRLDPQEYDDHERILMHDGWTAVCKDSQNEQDFQVDWHDPQGEFSHSTRYRDDVAFELAVERHGGAVSHRL